MPSAPFISKIATSRYSFLLLGCCLSLWLLSSLLSSLLNCILYKINSMLKSSSFTWIGNLFNGSLSWSNILSYLIILKLFNSLFALLDDALNFSFFLSLFFSSFSLFLFFFEFFFILFFSTRIRLWRRTVCFWRVWRWSSRCRWNYLGLTLLTFRGFRIEFTYCIDS